MRLSPDGWRGTIADGVTLDRVRRLAAACGAVLAAAPGRGRAGIVVAHDTRFLADRLAAAAAQALVSRGLPVVLLNGPVPAPLVSCAVAAGRRAAGFYVTGGDGPPEESGVGLYGPGGVPAAEELLRRIDHEARNGEGAPGPGPGGPAGPRRRARGQTSAPRRVDPAAAYLARLLRAVPAARLKRARLRLAADPRHGAASAWLAVALGRCASAIETIHDGGRPDF